MQLIAKTSAGGKVGFGASLEGMESGQSLRVPLRPPSPSLLLRMELENYFREARNRFEVCFSSELMNIVLLIH